MTLSVKLRAPIGEGKKTILSVITEFNVNISRIRQFDDGVCQVMCNSDRDVDNLLSHECVTALKSKDCLPIIPADLRAKRGVLVRGIDSTLFQFSVDEIIEEINSKNPWLIVDEVVLLHKSFCIKLVCASQQIAAKAVETGIKLYHYSFPPSCISRDKFVKITICYKCYKLDSHIASSCPENLNFKACSQCSSHTHTFRECDIRQKKCINCGGPHSALAYSCPKRREIERMKRQSSYNMSAVQPNVSYSASVAPSTSLSSSIIKAHICVAVASLSSSANSSSFQKTLDGILKENGLPSIRVTGVNIQQVNISGLITGCQKSNTFSSHEETKADPLSTNEDVSASQSSVISQEYGSVSLALAQDCSETPFVEVGTDRNGNSVRVTRSRTMESSHGASVDNAPAPRRPVSKSKSIRDLKVFKCKGTQRVNAGNVRALAAAGKIFIECSSASENQCLDILCKKGVISDLAFSSITELAQGEFIRRLSSGVYNMKSISNPSD